MNQSSKKRILVVDDNLPMRSALSETLKFLNYKTLEAENGQQALEIIEKSYSKPATGEEPELALILCDWSMPIMDGRGLFNEMKKRNLDIPFVMLSGYMTPGEAEEMIGTGMAGWLQKPADIRQISNLLEKILH
ncbi:MAG: response regulator [Bacteroidales bacterium]|jgi:CheY-like chemotaxis protein|nr:response regulator [Bacteroidales bacterium]